MTPLERAGFKDLLPALKHLLDSAISPGEADILECAIAEISRKDQLAWLIEWPEDDNVPVRWWHCKDGWMRDANKATWFCRQSDAQSFIDSHTMVGVVKATEHKFCYAPHMAAEG